MVCPDPNGHRRGDLRPVAAAIAALVLGLAAAACAQGSAPNGLGTGDQFSQQNAAPADDTGADSGTSSSSSSSSGGGSTPPPADGGTGNADSGGTTADAGPVTCTKSFTVSGVSLSNSSQCKDIDADVYKGAATATFTYPCAGGAATGKFGTQAFAGTVDAAGQLLVTNVTPFALGPCHFEATQAIKGNLGAAPLAWSYAERFTGGNCSGYIICTATAKVSVQ